jgi:multiple sugar transport system ATP-binding protein
MLASGDTGAPATVELIEPTGAEILLAAQLAGQRNLCAFRERHALKPGDAIRLAVDPATAHVFDKQTEQRISP